MKKIYKYHIVILYLDALLNLIERVFQLFPFYVKLIKHLICKSDTFVFYFSCLIAFTLDLWKTDYYDM